MVAEYVAQYGGTASGVNADVAEAYSVGEVTAEAITATGGTDNAEIISYLHSGVTPADRAGTGAVRRASARTQPRPPSPSSGRRPASSSRQVLPVIARRVCPAHHLQAALASAVG